MKRNKDKRIKNKADKRKRKCEKRIKRRVRKMGNRKRKESGGERELKMTNAVFGKSFGFGGFCGIKHYFSR